MIYAEFTITKEYGEKNNVFAGKACKVLQF